MPDTSPSGEVLTVAPTESTHFASPLPGQLDDRLAQNWTTAFQQRGHDAAGPLMAGCCPWRRMSGDGRDSGPLRPVTVSGIRQSSDQPFGVEGVVQLGSSRRNRKLEV